MWLSTINILFTILSLIPLIVCSTLVVHEKRDVPLRKDLDRSRIEKHALLPMRIGLRQNQHAIVNAEKWLMDVSDPDSPKYGHHWTQEEIIEAFQPSIETIRNVTSWLHSHEITEFTHSDNKLWFAFDTSVGRAESMLQTEYFEHITKEGEFKATCDYYHLPDHLQPHIDYITPGVKDSDVTGRTIRSRKRSLTPLSPRHKRTASTSALPASSSFPAIASHPHIPPFTSNTSLANCARVVTPACIRALYNFSMADPNLPISPNNTLGIFETENDFYSQPDLDQFFKYFEPSIPFGTSPIYQPIDGHTYPFTVKNGTGRKYLGVGTESDGDLMVSLPIIYPQNATVYEVLHNFGDRFNFFNKFFDAIDGSYCTYAQRGNSSMGGRPRCGILKPPNVMSYSWGVPEILVPAYWRERQCNEYLKLGLQGVSFFFASGDDGVGSITYDEGKPFPCGHSNITGGPRVFGPGWPPACPWVTTVGATQIRHNGTVEEPEIVAQWWGVYYGKVVSRGSSSGGFALSYKRPAYQADAVLSYFKNYNPPWPYFYDGHYENNTGRYNRNGRGFPDLSANGKTIASIYEYQFAPSAGASDATPIVASLFNRIIEERIRVGKGPLGFVNPTLYKHPEAFNDVVTGGNGWCALDEGFQAVPGWDPVTGLGTPNYGKLLDIFMKLP